MDPRKLLYLASIIEQGSLKKAAEQLHVSQPALSASMDRLETSLGVKLLERGPAGVVPTLSGELLYSHARLIRDEIGVAERQFGTLMMKVDAASLSEHFPSLASNVVPLALCKWRKDHPATPLRVVENVQVELLIGLLRMELDFIIGKTECYDFLDGLKQRVLFRDRLCVVARPSHPVFQMTEMSWAISPNFLGSAPTLDDRGPCLRRC